MKMPNRKIEKATGYKDVRFYLNEPYLDTENSLLIATNGNILAACPVELDEGDTSGTITAESIKAAIKASPHKGIRDKTANIKANGSLELDNGQSFPRAELTQPWVQYQRVIPDPDKATTVISLDAKLLKDLADAINTPGTSVIELHITDNTSPFYVKSDSKSECYGVIMPCRVM